MIKALKLYLEVLVFLIVMFTVLAIPVVPLFLGCLALMERGHSVLAGLLFLLGISLITTGVLYFTDRGNGNTLELQ